MWFKHSISIAQQLTPIYNTTVYKIRTRVLLPLMWLNCLCHKLKIPTDHKGGAQYECHTAADIYNVTVHKKTNLVQYGLTAS